jgi:hypothetical protein
LIVYASKFVNFDVDLIWNKCSDVIIAGTKDSKISTRQFPWEDKGLVPEAAVLRVRSQPTARREPAQNTIQGKISFTTIRHQDGNKEEK